MAGLLAKRNFPSVSPTCSGLCFVALINGKPEILSTFKYIYDALGIVSTEEDEFRNHYTL